MWLQIAIVIFLTIMFLYKRRKDVEGLPPGDSSWPVIGTLLLTAEDQITFIQQQKKKHGGIFRAQLGFRTYIYLTDYETIKTAYAQFEFSERVQCVSNNILSLHTDHGISFSRLWHENKQFASKHLRDLGMGRKWHEDAIMREITEMLEYLERSKGEPTFIDHPVEVTLVNIIWGIVAGHRYSIDDEKCHEFSSYNKLLQNHMQGLFSLLDLFPFLNNILPQFIKNKWMNLDKIDKIMQNIEQFGKDVVQEHEQRLDRSHPRDFVDMYLLQRESEQKLGEITQRSNELDLVVSLFHLYGAGSDTTTVTTKWFVMHMALFPEVQAKIHKELDAVVTGSRLPSLDDKSQLPYLEATINEVQRHRTLLPLLMPHSNLEEATINGYRIPKGSTIIASIDDVHHDSRYWKHPNKFYPEHFLDDDGKFNNKKEGYLPFGIGRRVCLGESLAKMSVFLVTAALLKEFNILPVPGAEPDLTSNASLFISFPKPFKVILQKRS